MKVHYYHIDDMRRAIASIALEAVTTPNDARLAMLMIQSGLIAYGRGGGLYLLDRKRDNRYVIEIDATGRVLR